MAGTAGHFGNFNGRKLSGSFQFILILQPKMTKIILTYKTYKELYASIIQAKNEAVWAFLKKANLPLEDKTPGQSQISATYVNSLREHQVTISGICIKNWQY